MSFKSSVFGSYLVAFALLFPSQVCAQLNLEYMYNYSFGNLTAVHFANDNVGLVAEPNSLKLTIDGGKTWRSKYLPGITPSNIAVSIQGTDTLFIISDLLISGNVKTRVRYFHGFNSQPIELYKSTMFLWGTLGSISIRDSIIYIAGDLYDTTKTIPSSWRPEPMVLESKDHGITWNKVIIPTKPSGNYYSIESTHFRGGDTIAVCWSKQILSTSLDFSFGLYYGDFQSVILPLNGVRGRILDCYNDKCLIYESSPQHQVSIQQGNDPTNSKVALTEWCMDDWYPMKFYSEAEFININIPLVTCRPDSAGMYSFTYDFSKPSDSLIIDTNIYNYWSQVPKAFLGGPAQTSVTENYVYVLQRPYILKISKSELDIKNLRGSLDNIDVSYHSHLGELSVFGLKPNRNYEYQLYSISGNTVMHSSKLLTHENNRINIHGISSGVYLIQISKTNSPNIVMKKVVISQ